MPARHAAIRAGLFSALLVPAACGNDSGTAEAAHEGRPPVVIVSPGRNGATLPAYLPEYPGARVTARIAGKPGAEGGMPDGAAVLVMRSPDPIARIVAFYDAEAARAGIRPSMQIDDEGDAVRMYADAKRGQGSLLAVSRSKDGKESEIVISVGGGEVAVATNTAPQPRDSKLTAFADLRLQ